MQRDLAVFKACADATRLRLLFLLAQRELCVCELVEVLDMAQGKVSRHLAVLKQAQLVQDRREGTWIYYSLGGPGSGLRRRLVEYLTEVGEDNEVVQGDVQRLCELAAPGEICASQETPVMANGDKGK
jgi:ArsR family transcriptional regulator